MATITPDKTVGTVALTHQAATHPTTIIGSWLDVSSKRSGVMTLYHAYVEATADTNYGWFQIQGRSGANARTVHNLTSPLSAKGTTPDTEAMTATEPVGETTLAVASTTGFAVGDNLYIQDTGTLTDSEWHSCKTFVANTNIQLIDGLVVEKDSSDVIWNDSSIFVVPLDLTPYDEVRVVWTHEGATGANGHVAAFLNTHDSDTSA